jgi:hypothetical protein
MPPPPRVGAGQLWLFLLAVGYALSCALRATPAFLQRAGFAGGAASAPRAHDADGVSAAEALLRRRDGRRVVLLALPRSGAGALCRLAGDNGEVARAHAGCAPAGGGAAARALRVGTPAAQCAALRAQPLSYLALPGGLLPDAPWLDAGALYVGVLREPRARYVSVVNALRARAAEAHGKVCVAGCRSVACVVWRAALR